MNKVYTLEYGYNQYDQLGNYTIAIFKEKPTYEMLLAWSQRDDAVHSPNSEDALRRLAEEGYVAEYECGGGDDWTICEVDVL